MRGLSASKQCYGSIFRVHHTFVHDFMVTDVKYISLSTPYQELQDMLIASPNLKTFPLVDTPSSLILLGSIPRGQLETELERQVGERARREEAQRRRRKQSDESRAAEEELMQSVLSAERRAHELHKDSSGSQRKASEADPNQLGSSRFLVTPVDPGTLDKLHKVGTNYTRKAGCHICQLTFFRYMMPLLEKRVAKNLRHLATTRDRRTAAKMSQPMKYRPN